VLLYGTKDKDLDDRLITDLKKNEKQKAENSNNIRISEKIIT